MESTDCGRYDALDVPMLGRCSWSTCCHPTILLDNGWNRQNCILKWEEMLHTFSRKTFTMGCRRGNLRIFIFQVNCSSCDHYVEVLLLLLSCRIPAFLLLLEHGSRLRKTAWMAVIAKVPQTPPSHNLASKSDTRLNAQVPSNGKGCIPVKSVPKIIKGVTVL